MIIASINQKGGVGKTTTSVHLLHWLLKKKKETAILIDSDFQQSSSAWAKQLKMPHQSITNPEDVFDELQELSNNYDNVVVDGPAGASEVTKAILCRCDLALIPCQPSGLDLHSTNKTLRYLAQTQELRDGKPKACIYLNAAKKNTNLLKESIDFLSSTSISVPLLETIIYHRQCISDAPGQGITVFDMDNSASKASSHEFDLLFSEALAHI